jgi:hypothetical protein
VPADQRIPDVDLEQMRAVVRALLGQASVHDVPAGITVTGANLVELIAALNRCLDELQRLYHETPT